MPLLLSCIMTPGIGRLILEPAKYQPEVARLSILCAAAEYYSVTLAKLRRMGPTTGNPPVLLADRIATQIRELIDTRELTDEEKAISTFAHAFDNELLAHARSGNSGRARANEFYVNAFLKLGKKDAKIKEVLRDDDARELALMDAIQAFIRHFESPDFVFEKTARDYFFGIFKKRCYTRLTELTKPKNQIRNRTDPDELISQLPARGQVLFEDLEELEITSGHFRRFGQDHPDKMKLLNLRSIQRWTYAQLAGHFGVKKGAIRVQVHRARKLLKDKYLGRS